MINIEKSSTQRCSVKKNIHVFICVWLLYWTYLFLFFIVNQKSKVLLELQKMFFVYNEKIVEATKLQKNLCGYKRYSLHVICKLNLAAVDYFYIAA